MSQENVEVAEKVLAAFADRYMDAVLAFLDSEVTWTTAEDESDRQIYEGHDGVRHLCSVWSPASPPADNLDGPRPALEQRRRQ